MNNLIEKSVRVGAAVVALGLGGSAWAAPASPPSPEAERARLLFGLGGTFDWIPTADCAEPEGFATTTCLLESEAFGLYLQAEYQFPFNLGVGTAFRTAGGVTLDQEFSVPGVPRASARIVDGYFDPQTVDLYVRPYLDLEHELMVSLVIGVSRWNADSGSRTELLLDGAVVEGNDNRQSDSGWGLLFGVGLEKQVTETWSLHLDYRGTRLKNEDAEIRELIHEAMIGVSWSPLR